LHNFVLAKNFYKNKNACQRLKLIIRNEMGGIMTDELLRHGEVCRSDTASTHYGKKRVGRGKCIASPSPADVDRLNQKLQSNHNMPITNMGSK